MVLPLLTALFLAGAGLDQAAVRKHYADGELDRAAGILEDFVRAGDRFTREESLFIYKHLGVIHSHRKETRQKGKANFHQLLQIDPEAGILDMQAGAEVQQTFREAQAERSAALAAPDAKRVVARFETVPATEGRRPSTWSGTGRTWVWVGAAGLGVTGAMLGYHYLVDSEVPKDKVISLTD